MLDTPPNATTQRPGDFRRRGQDGPPWVASVDKTRRPKGNKAELVAKCEARGLDIDGTVDQLVERLGPEPRDELYARPSSYGDPLENQSNLERWKERKILSGVWHLLQRQTFPEWLDHPDDEALDNLAARCHEAAGTKLAADRGTHVHRLTERHDRGEPFDDLIDAGKNLGIPESLQRRIVEQWAETRGAMRVTARAVEQPVVNDDLRAAGTVDRIDVCGQQITTPFGTIAAGEPFVGDIKTGKLIAADDGTPQWWVTYPVQLAVYADAVPYDVDTDTRGTW